MIIMRTTAVQYSQMKSWAVVDIECMIRTIVIALIMPRTCKAIIDFCHIFAGIFHLIISNQNLNNSVIFKL